MTTWAQVAHVPSGSGSPRRRSTAATALALVVAFTPILIRASRQGLNQEVMAGLAISILILIPRRPWYVAVAILGVAAALTARFALPGFGLIVLANGLSCLVAFGGEPLPPRGQRVDALSRVLVGASFIVGQVVMLRTNRLSAIALLVVAGLFAGLMLHQFRPLAGERAVNRIDSLAVRFGGTLAGVLAVVGVGPLVLIIWLAHRLTGFDPLRAPTAPGTNWVRRHAVRVDAERPYAIVGVDVPHPGWRRAHRTLAGAVALPLLVAFGALAASLVVHPLDAIRDYTKDPFQPLAADDAKAARAEPWFKELESGLGKVRMHWETMGVFQTGDVASRYVNVSDGRRATWTPPACDCERLQVWMFGGSSIFGFWQRDDHTIASELARVAWDQGIALDVVNFGQPAYTHWQEVSRLTYLLATEDKPDLVLFMDGANEFGVQRDRNNHGFGNDISPSSALDAPMRSLFPTATERLGWIPVGERRPSTEGDDPKLSPGEVAARSVERYSESLEAARLLLDGQGIARQFTWQPIFVGPDEIGDIEFVGADQMKAYRQMREASRALLPENVVDLSAALDGAGEVVFHDSMHLNEPGARLIAERWFDELGPELRALTADP